MKKNYIFIGLVIVVILVVILGLFGKNPTGNLGGTAGIVPATVATSSFQTVVAATAELLFATSTNCASRIITTTESGAVRLTFSDLTGQRPTGVNGHVQATSTTVTYPAEDYGCNAVWVFPYQASTLTVTETR